MGTIVCECSFMGALSKLLIEEGGSAPRTFDASSERVEFVYEKLRTIRAIQYTGAITGTLTRFIRGARKKSTMVQGVIAVQPSAGNLEKWLPRIFGGPAGAAGSGTGWNPDADGQDKDIPLSNIIPEWDALAYRENGIFQYTDMKVAQAYIRGRSSNGGDSIEFLEMILVVVGQQEIITQSGDPSPWPSPEPDLATDPQFDAYAVWETDLLLNDVEVPFIDFTLMVNNNLLISFYNELYPQCIRSAGRDIILEANLPFQCAALAEAINLNEAVGTAELRMSREDTAEYHTAIELPFSMNHFTTPVTEGKGENPLPIKIEAFGEVGLDEAIITNDAAIDP